MRFRAEQHLRRQSDIRAVREQGRRVDCRAFTVWWKLRTPASATTAQPEALPDVALAKSGPRVCVIASTAAVGHAVLRNRAKRRLREIFRAQQHLVPVGCDLLLVARHAATREPIPALEKRFGEACAQISRPASPQTA
jgi:ribonuclease P protein component